MGSHLIDGNFQSDKYPSTPRGKVPLSVKDPSAQDLLWTYAERHESVDPEFSADLRTALLSAGYLPVVVDRQCPFVVSAIEDNALVNCRFDKNHSGDHLPHDDHVDAVLPGALWFSGPM